MRRILYCAILSLVAATSLILAGCPRGTGERSGRGLTPSGCPTGMAYVKAARVCMDIFEYPNVSGEVPLGNVKWKQASKLCRDQGKRLPTMKEWEAACAGKNDRAFPYGSEYIEKACRVDFKPGDGPAPSGASPECHTPDGIYDLSGNMWEWTSTQGFEKGTYYVKGGSWLSYKEVAICNLKAWEPPDEGGPDYGFRCVK